MPMLHTFSGTDSIEQMKFEARFCETFIELSISARSIIVSKTMGDMCSLDLLLHFYSLLLNTAELSISRSIEYSIYLPELLRPSCVLQL